MITARKARIDEFERIAAFYHANGYDLKFSLADTIVVAECDGEFCGALGLCEENDWLVLRGMRVSQGLRRQGIGTQLLKTAELFIGDRVCFCIPHRHLQSFYGQVGFVWIDEKESPVFLRERCDKYRREYGLDVIIMYRPVDIELRLPSFR